MSKPVERITQDDLFQRLTILDGKCSGMLQLSAVILTLTTIAVPTAQPSHLASTLLQVIAVVFLVVSLLALSVIWVDWRPTMAVLRWRTTAYKICLMLSAVGVVLITVCIFRLAA